MDNINNKIIGSGALFPIELHSSSKGIGWYPVNGDIRLIHNNLESLMVHYIGERIRQEDFGTRIWECLEEPNTQALGFLVNFFLKEALAKWENRVIFRSSKVVQHDSILHITLEYSLVNTSIIQSLDLTYNNLTNTLS